MPGNCIIEDGGHHCGICWCRRSSSGKTGLYSTVKPEKNLSLVHKFLGILVFICPGIGGSSELPCQV